MNRKWVVSAATIAAAVMVFAPVFAQVGDTPGQIIKTYNWKFGTNQVADISAGDSREMMVSSGCDVNGDGYEDLLVGDRDYDYLAARDDNGRAWLFLGGLSGLSTTPSLTFNPPLNNTNGFFGTQVACAGDVDNDGYEDIMIGMDNYDSSFIDEGAVFVYHGSATGPGTTHTWMARGNSQFAHFGISLDGAGDVNNDGYDDIIVGTLELYSYSGHDAYIWFGGAGGLGVAGLPTNADWYVTGPNLGNQFGRIVRGIGDINGDSYDDVMIADHGYDGGGSNTGAVYVWHGSATGPVNPGTVANSNWSATSGQVEARLGFGGDGVGDLNCDGYDDIAIGAYLYDNPEVNEGKVFVWFGSAGGLGSNGTPANADWSAESNVGASMGYVVRPGGDVNGDGCAELLVTAYNYPYDANGGALAGAGAWFMWSGSAGGLGDNGTPANADIAGYGNQEGALLGRDDAGVADVNGDGLDDIFVAAVRYDDPEVDEGVIFGYFSGLKAFLPIVVR